MPENEFEKQVKELMEELRFSPSAPVWEKVKKRISEKKRRVWPIFFLFVSVALVSGYFFYTDIKHAHQNAGKNFNRVTTASPKKEIPDNTTHEENTTQDSGTEKQLKPAPFVAHKVTKKNPVSVVKHLNDNEIVSAHKPSARENNSGLITNISPDKNATVHHQLSNPNNSINAITKASSDSNYIAENSIVNNDTAIDSVIKLSNESGKDSTAVHKKNQAKKIIKNNKWHFGVSAMYGISNLTNNALNFNGDKSLQTSASLGNPRPTATNPGALKNPYDKNNAYSFGLVVQRKILKNSSINSGLNFVHLSSKSNTALSINYALVAVADYLQNNNTASNFYRIGSVKTYTNSFNFIELPATFQSSLFKIKHFSVVYNAGGSVMHMISSKSFIYNSNNNNFFKNDSLLRHTQFQLTAGLDFQFSTKNKGAILLGPHVEYSLSPYLKNNDYNRLHFVNYGLRASWLFKK